MKVKICIVNFLGEDRKIEVCLLYVLISLKYKFLSSADIVIESGKQGDLGNLEGNMKFLKIYIAKITELCLEST